MSQFDKLIKICPLGNGLREIERNVILAGYRGSQAHGTFQENITHDDVDVIGIYVDPERCLFGLDKMEVVEGMFEEKVSSTKTVTWDIVMYSLKKFLSLVLKQNPNILTLLWCNDKNIIKNSPWGERLRQEKRNLLSKQAYHSFSGYAYRQLHRMTHQASTGRMGQKRKDLVAEFGYDVKNASHLIRILKMGIELLTTNEIVVERPDSSMLLEIKRGEWSLDRVLKFADQLFADISSALVACSLPSRIDYEKVNDLCETIIKDFSGIGGLNFDNINDKSR